MSNKDRCLVVIITMGSLADVQKCVASLRGSSTNDFDILLVENSKTSCLPGNEADIESIVAGGNIGFANGNNLGIRISVDRGYFATFLLNDDMVLEPRAMELLLASLRDNPRIGLAGPVTMFQRQPQKIWAAGGKVCRWRVRVYGKTAKADKLQKVDYLPGSGVMFRNSLVESIGLLPDKYFFAYEEAEFCLRARSKGFLSVVNPEAIAYHKVGITSKTAPVLKYNDFRNRFIFSEYLHGPLLGRCLSRLIVLREVLVHDLSSATAARRAWQHHLLEPTIRLKDLLAVENELSPNEPSRIPNS